MSKAGESILRGARQALAYARGAREGFIAHVPAEVDIKALRRRLGLSQRQFAQRFGFELDALQNWEQGRRRPEGPARILLKVIEHDPDTVQEALTARNNAA
jgi:putative transcriptional regulator